MRKKTPEGEHLAWGCCLLQTGRGTVLRFWGEGRVGEEAKYQGTEDRLGVLGEELFAGVYSARLC